MWLERKYTTMLGGRLERFQLKKDVASFRCPVCNDSKINKYKTRGLIILKPTGSYFYCHNCHASKKFGDFLKFVDPLMFDDYLKELLAEKYVNHHKDDDESFSAKPEFKPIDAKLAKLKRISQLPHDHPAKAYVEGRGIPSHQHHRLYYVPKFKAWVNSIVPRKFEKVDYDEPRLILPFLDADKKFYGFQGRSFRKKVDPRFRYITIMVDEDRPKVFGLDSVDLTRDFTAVEGPIDSLFLNNCIATAGGKLQVELNKMGVDPSKGIIAYDNEPRNSEVVANIEQSIDMGYRVVIWPDDQTAKDVNQMVQEGLKDPNRYLPDHTYQGLRAKLELQRWRKC